MKAIPFGGGEPIEIQLVPFETIMNYLYPFMPPQQWDSKYPTEILDRPDVSEPTGGPPLILKGGAS